MNKDLLPHKDSVSAVFPSLGRSTCVADPLHRKTSIRPEAENRQNGPQFPGPTMALRCAREGRLRRWNHCHRCETLHAKARQRCSASYLSSLYPKKRWELAP